MAVDGSVVSALDEAALRQDLLALKGRGEKRTLTAFATNLTDEKYLEEVIPAPEFGGSFNHPGSNAVMAWSSASAIRSEPQMPGNGNGCKGPVGVRVHVLEILAKKGD